jgi:acetylornithine deacetylase/succinyl-diaminopimelate desuccinylase-like protein
MENKMIDKDAVTELTKQLIAIPSAYFEEKDIMAFVKDWFCGVGIDAEIHDYHEHRITGHQGKISS